MNIYTEGHIGYIMANTKHYWSIMPRHQYLMLVQKVLRLHLGKVGTKIRHLGTVGTKNRRLGTDGTKIRLLGTDGNKIAHLGTDGTKITHLGMDGTDISYVLSLLLRVSQYLYARIPNFAHRIRNFLIL